MNTFKDYRASDIDGTYEIRCHGTAKTSESFYYVADDADGEQHDGTYEVPKAGTNWRKVIEAIGASMPAGRRVIEIAADDTYR